MKPLYVLFICCTALTVLGRFQAAANGRSPGRERIVSRRQMGGKLFTVSFTQLFHSNDHRESCQGCKHALWYTNKAIVHWTDKVTAIFGI